MSSKPAVYFITGTDTGAGKSLVAAAFLKAAASRGVSTVGVKPVAAGCEETPDGPRSEDALLLRQYSSIAMPYEMSNPVSLRLPVAPHLAAAQEGRKLDAGRLEGFCRAVLMKRAGLTLIEGAGGWQVPLNGRQSLADLAKLLGVPVILVVGMRLGCINHALLTARAIHADGLELAGWVANRIDPDMALADENIDAIAERMSAPCLGRIPALGHLSLTERVAAAAAQLQLEELAGLALPA
jgi:dethiobiotin synthetase